MSFTYTPFFLPGFGGSIPGTGVNSGEPTTIVHPTTTTAFTGDARATTNTTHTTTPTHTIAYNGLAATTVATPYTALAGYGAHHITTYTTPLCPPIPKAPDQNSVSNAQYAALAADVNWRSMNQDKPVVIPDLFFINIQSGDEDAGQIQVFGPVPFQHNVHLYRVIQPTTVNSQNIAVWPAGDQLPPATTVTPPVLANVALFEPVHYATTSVPTNQVILFSSQNTGSAQAEGAVEPAWVMMTKNPTTIQYYQARAVETTPGQFFSGPAAPPQGNNDEGTV